MAATYDTQISTGAGPSNATAANVRFNTTDDNVQDTTQPMVVPAAGTNYSYWKSVYLNVTGAADNDVDNVRFFSDGTIGWGTGVTLNVGDQTTSTYVQATGTDGTTGDEVVANHSQISSVTDAASLTSGSPLAVSDTNIGTGTGIASDYVVMQVAVASTAGPGTLSAETLTWRVDET